MLTLTLMHYGYSSFDSLLLNVCYHTDSTQSPIILVSKQTKQKYCPGYLTWATYCIFDRVCVCV